MADLMLQLDPNERILYTVRRSFFGIIVPLLLAAATFFGLLIIVFIIARFPERLDNLASVPMAVVVVTAVAFLIETIIYILVTTYFRNILVVTNESVLQRLQTTPFSSQTSQLNLRNIEDVSVKRSGFFASTFNFGTLTVLTAGEQANFIFPFARNPNQAAHVIIEAHEALEQPPPPSTPQTAPPAQPQPS